MWIMFDQHLANLIICKSNLDLAKVNYNFESLNDNSIIERGQVKTQSTVIMNSNREIL